MLCGEAPTCGECHPATGSPGSHPGSLPGASRAPSWCPSALCPLFLSSSTSHHPARITPTRPRVALCPWQHLRVSRMGWAPWLLLQEGPWQVVLCRG